MRNYNCIVCDRHYAFDGNWPEELVCSWLWTKPRPIIDADSITWISVGHSYGMAKSEWQIRDTVWHCVECVVPDAISINYNTTDSIASYRIIELPEKKRIDLVSATGLEKETK